MSVVEVGDRSKFIGDLPGRSDRVQVTEVMIVARSFRANVRRRGDDKLLFIEMEPDSPVEGRRVVVVVDTGIDPARDAGDEVQPLGCIKSKERAGVIEWDGEIENVAVRIKRVGAGIDCFRSFKGNELAEFQIDAALGHDGKMEA